MMMKKFDNDLDALRRRVVEMGAMVRSMVSESIESLLDPNKECYENILAQEEEVDKIQLEIDREAIRLLTVYSPVATDLRFVLSVSRINRELERIADQAVNICEDLQLVAERDQQDTISELKKMARLVSGMLRDAIASFVQDDYRKAVEVIATDDLVDALNDQIVRELLSDQVVREAISGPRNIAGALAFILLARSLERIADQATNICEEVVYIVKGDDIRHREPHLGDMQIHSD